jgi:hypothetical protein
LNEAVFIRLTPYSDDTWLKAMSLLNGTQCKKVAPFSPYYIPIRRIRKKTLGKITRHGKKDEQIQAVLEYYNLYNIIGKAANRYEEVSN